MMGKSIIGITGVMGSGKSQVSACLAGITGYSICDADATAHEIYRSGSLPWRGLVDCFGLGIINAQGEIDRAVLGAIVFNDPAKLKALEQIVHPPLVAVLHQKVAEARQAGKGLILDAALLFELSLDKICDVVWVVDAPEEILFNRLAKRSGIGQDAAKKRMDAQYSSEIKKQKADQIIHNYGDYSELAQQVSLAWARFRG